MALITSKKVKEGIPSLPLAINLNPYQQIRLMAVEGGKPAYRVWKYRMRQKGSTTNPIDYILNGYRV